MNKVTFWGQLQMLKKIKTESKENRSRRVTVSPWPPFAQAIDFIGNSEIEEGTEKGFRNRS